MQSNTNEKNEKNNTINELERRLDITRRARFNCSTRLRKYFDRLQNIIIYYNIFVVLLSIITLYQFYIKNDEWITYVTLAISISLSFFATHIGGKNYKEKAIKMENNGHELSKIYGKIKIIKLNFENIEKDKVKDFFKEYEKTLINVENHEDIDYWMAKKMKGTITTEEIKGIQKFLLKDKISFVTAYFIPIVLFFTVIVIPLI